MSTSAARGSHTLPELYSALRTAEHDGESVTEPLRRSRQMMPLRSASPQPAVESVGLSLVEASRAHVASAGMPPEIGGHIQRGIDLLRLLGSIGEREHQPADVAPLHEAIHAAFYGAQQTVDARVSALSKVVWSAQQGGALERQVASDRDLAAQLVD